jgi:hypothetical protein
VEDFTGTLAVGRDCGVQIRLFYGGTGNGPRSFFLHTTHPPDIYYAVIIIA